MEAVEQRTLRLLVRNLAADQLVLLQRLAQLVSFLQVCIQQTAMSSPVGREQEHDPAVV